VSGVRISNVDDVSPVSAARVPTWNGEYGDVVSTASHDLVSQRSVQPSTMVSARSGATCDAMLAMVIRAPNGMATHEGMRPDVPCSRIATDGHRSSSTWPKCRRQPAWSPSWVSACTLTVVESSYRPGPPACVPSGPDVCSLTYSDPLARLTVQRLRNLWSSSAGSGSTAMWRVFLSSAIHTGWLHRSLVDW